MHLIYINEIGSDFKGQKQYEFIFSESHEIDMENWFHTPASSCFDNKVPDLEHISKVGLLKNTDLDMELIQNSDYFSVFDSVTGIIAMGWEKYDEESENERIFFKFAESYETVMKKLKKRNYNLILEEVTTNE